MPELSYLREQTCIVGIGETAYTRGTPKSALELALEASMSAIADAGLAPEAIDAVILPGGAGSGGTVRLQATVQEPVRIAHPARRQIILQGHWRALHEGIGMQMGMLTHGYRHRA